MGAWVHGAWVHEAWVHEAWVHGAWVHEAWVHEAWVHGCVRQWRLECMWRRGGEREEASWKKWQCSPSWREHYPSPPKLTMPLGESGNNPTLSPTLLSTLSPHTSAAMLPNASFKMCQRM